MSFLLEQDALNGKAGRAFAVIDGRNVEMFGLKKMQADAEFQEADFTVVGTNLVQKKTKGVTLTGSFTIYYGTPEFLNMLKTYLKTGRLPYFTIQITNDDKGTTVGAQTVALYNVKLSKLPIAILDDSADYLSMDVSFSFTNVEILNAFGAPAQLGE
ncbi:phage tail tube protein [Lacrimispora sp.]|uniref:phage tail tube protein n=1 Tax=Lacrimispora sp. TaxID=2719234 RepID=UPI002861FAF0|nr:phage tail tube protein [Lacrimispora sp.]MDR7813387.1 phage tail tube protein [Lacrimispora sp.]